jgi:hypothetical protein
MPSDIENKTVEMEEDALTSESSMIPGKRPT